jgi:hypothetical protein
VVEKSVWARAWPLSRAAAAAAVVAAPEYRIVLQP